MVSLSAWEVVKHRTTKKCPTDSSVQNQTQTLEEQVGLQGQVCTTTVSPRQTLNHFHCCYRLLPLRAFRANSQINAFHKIKSPVFVARYWHIFLDYILTEKKNPNRKTDQGNSIKLHLFSLYKFLFIITQFNQRYLQPMAHYWSFTCCHPNSNGQKSPRHYPGYRNQSYSFAT